MSILPCRLRLLVMTIVFACACQSPKPQTPSLVQAEKLFEQQKFIESAQVLSKLLDQDPNLPGARNILSRCFFFLGNPDRSIEELQFVMTHAPANSEQTLDALFLMGAVSLESSNLSELNHNKSRKAWELYLKIAPKSELREQVKKGLVELKSFENPKLATDLARSYVRKSDPNKALKVFSRMLKKHPKHAPAWHYQGMAYIMSGDPQRAIASWKQVMHLDAKYAKNFRLDERIKVAEKI